MEEQLQGLTRLFHTKQIQIDIVRGMTLSGLEKTVFGTTSGMLGIFSLM